MEVRTAPVPAEELIVAQRPPWLTAAAQKLSSLMALPENWDSYGARPVSFNTVASAFQLLERLHASGLTLPRIVPLASGGIQFEWAAGELELELSLEPGDRMTALFDDSSGGESWERELAPRDLTPIRDVLRRVARGGRSG